MFSCSAAKQYERLDHLASARKSVIEAELVAHLQQANFGIAAGLPVEVVIFPLLFAWLADLYAAPILSIVGIMKYYCL